MGGEFGIYGERRRVLCASSTFSGVIMGFLLRHLHLPLVGFSMYMYQKRRGMGLKLSPRIMGQRRDGNICRILGLEATGAIFRGAGILSIGGRGTIKGWGKGVTTSMPLNISLFTLHSCNIGSFLALLWRFGLVSAFVYGAKDSLLVNRFWLKGSGYSGDGDGVKLSADRDMHLLAFGNPDTY